LARIIQPLTSLFFHLGCSISQVTEKVKDAQAGHVGHRFRNCPRSPLDGPSSIENDLGTLAEREALFWLEVERGNTSREALRRKTGSRFEGALHYARRFSLSLVFALLTPPWARQAMVEIFVQVPGDAAIVLADWKAFGALPLPQWGLARAA
jgi:hypothetical protein